MLWNGIVDSKSDKASEAPVDPAQLHKKMLQLLSSLWVTRAVGTFARLGLADVMEDGVEDHAAIAAARGLGPDRVYRLLRALSTVGLVTEPTRGRFTLTPLGRLLSSHAPNNTRTTAIFLNDYFADMWTHLDDALTGERTAFEALKGRPFFEWLARASGRSQALQPHDARGARSGDAGDRRRLRFLARSITSSTSAAATARCCPPCSPPTRTGARRCSTWRRRSPPPSAARAGRCRA